MMTQEKKYDEALERARDLMTKQNPPAFSKDLISLVFPELAESEDERIRKGILELVRQSSEILDKQNQKDMIAWLEKQGEQKPNPYSGTSFEYNGHIWGMCARDNGVDILLDKQLFKHLENQAEHKPYGQRKECEDCQFNYAGECKGYCASKRNEQKPILDFKASDWYVSKVDGKINNMYYSVDKVEPKFKVGDWITDGFLHCKISNVLDDRYIVDTKFAKRSSIFFKCENNYHLWTIQDANDGDVLVNGSNIFIFHFLNGTRLMGYCHVNINDGRFYDDIGKIECFCLIDAEVTPATKEQRDFLFQKMAEEGYVWDSEKKELFK